MSQQHILITGGNGLIGRHLTQALLKQGHRVSHLSRKPAQIPDVTTFVWDVDQQKIDEASINGVDTIIHLAGAGVAEKRWTDERKKEIINSRVNSIRLLYNLLKRKPHQVKSVISASATGYYGNRGDKVLTEQNSPAHDFLGDCCIKWEAAVDEGKALGLRIVKYRTGVVLSTEGGALPQLAAPVKIGFGAPLGSGRQWIPWIHLQDVVNLYVYAVNDSSMQGVFNMTAPAPVTNWTLTHRVARQLKKPLWLPSVPAFLLKLLFGEMSVVVMGSTRAVPQALQQINHPFAYPDIESALQQLYE